MGDPCGWVVGTCGCGTCWDGYSPATRDRAQALAAGLMWAATGRRYGLCEVTVLPCNPLPAPALYRDYPVAYDTWGEGGAALLLPGLQAAGGCGAGCRCAAACEVALPGPVESIIEVTVGGAVVDGGYEVHDRALLVRADGSCWPTCQTFGVQVAGFTATYLRGDPIPTSVQAAFEVVACEYAKACVGGACRLPPRLARLSRSGAEVTVAQVDNSGQATGGKAGQLRTGIPLVDDAIAADNPYGRTGRPVVMSPDYPPPAREVTWSGGS